MKTKNIIGLTLMFMIALTTGFAMEPEEEKRECFQTLNEKYNIELNYSSFESELNNADYTPLRRTWTNLEFTKTPLFIKLVHFGEKSSFSYDYRNFTEKKIGSMQWPNNHDKQAFLQYSRNFSTGKNTLVGCGMINMTPLNDYTLKTLTNENNVDTRTSEWEVTYNEDENKLWYSSSSKGFDQEGTNSVQWDTYHVYFKDKNVLFNSADAIPGYVESILQYKEGKTQEFNRWNREFIQSHPEIKPYTRYGMIRADIHEKYFQNIDNPYVKIILTGFQDIRSQENYYIEKQSNQSIITYPKEYLLKSNFTETQTLIKELSVIDDNYNRDLRKEIEKDCGNINYTECIGKNLTKIFLNMTTHKGAVNIFVDSVLSTNPFYSLDNPEKINHLIENDKLIFKINAQDEIKNTYDPVPSNTVSYQPHQNNLPLIPITFVTAIVVVIGVFSVMWKKRKK